MRQYCDNHKLDDVEKARALKKQTLANACRTILQCIGEDPDREGLLRTPERFAEAMLTFTAGYEQNIVGTKTQWTSFLLIRACKWCII